jgi:hypothetical protein
MNKDLQNLAAAATTKADQLRAAISEMQQPRSDYMIERFVVGQHRTPERQYHQCIIELQLKHDAIRRAMLEIRREEVMIEAADLAIKTPPQSGLSWDIAKELARLEIQERRWNIENAEMRIRGWLGEFDALYAIFEAMPKFTDAQLQAAEAAYWLERLERQAAQDIAQHGSIGVGNAEALLQIGHPAGLMLSDPQQVELLPPATEEKP